MKNPFRSIETMFLWSSGAHVETLRKVPEEKSKYFGIGGTIIFTALMATFAGGYAVNLAFDNITISILFGIFWGLLIFNLDRYIVSSFGIGDGKKTISRQELIEAAPRLMMAIILGIVISTPLELKLFQKEITSEISELNTKQFSVHDSTVRILLEKQIIPNTKEIKDLESQIDKKNEELKIKEVKRDQANSEMIKEAEGTSGTMKRGKGPLFKEKELNYNNLKDEYTQLKEEYDVLYKSNKKRIESLKSKKDNILEKFKIDEEGYATIKRKNDGLMAQLKALDSLTSKNTFLLIAKWLITLLFIFIEIAPVLFKMMTERGPYDDLMDQIKYEYKVSQLLKKSNLNTKINTEVRLHSEKNSQKLRAELMANNKLLTDIAKAQAEIALVAIDAWKESQLEKVRNDPSEIIKSGIKKN